MRYKKIMAMFLGICSAALLAFSACGADNEDADVSNSGTPAAQPKLPTTWVSESLGYYVVINKIAFGNGVFAAAGRDGSAASYATYADYLDETTLLWRTNADYASFSTENMHCFFGGGWFVAHPSSSGNNHWSKSQDGKTWTAIGDKTTWPGGGDNYPYINSKGGAYGEVNGEGYWVIGGSGGRICYSSDLTTWTMLEREQTKFDNPQGGPKVFINAVAFGNGVFVAGGGSGHVVWSGNPAGEWHLAEQRAADIPANWPNGGEIVETIFDNGFINAIVFSEEKKRFVAVGGLDGLTGKTAYSDDGMHWYQGSNLTPLGVGDNCSMSAAAYGGGIFLIGDSKGNAAYSTDGKTWALLSKIDFGGGASGGINSLCYGNGIWAASSGSRIAYSVTK